MKNPKKLGKIRHAEAILPRVLLFSEEYDIMAASGHSGEPLNCEAAPSLPKKSVLPIRKPYDCAKANGRPSGGATRLRKHRLSEAISAFRADDRTTQQPKDGTSMFHLPSAAECRRGRGATAVGGGKMPKAESERMILCKRLKNCAGPLFSF